MSETVVDRLILPCENAEEWCRIETVLKGSVKTPSDLDSVITTFSVTEQKCKFFSTVPATEEGKTFDWEKFFAFGLPFMTRVALEMPALFANVKADLLLTENSTTQQTEANKSVLRSRKVTLTRRQCACLLAHSAFGSITAAARPVRKEKWAFRAAQLFFLEAIPSALCLLNYFKRLGEMGVADGAVTFERRAFTRGTQPWNWNECTTPLCPLEIVDAGSIELSPAEVHIDFANRFVGGGALENDFYMEEILFAIKPELIVSMALCSFMQDEECIAVSGAMQHSNYSGFASSFAFEGDAAVSSTQPPATVVAIDALQGMSKIQFKHGLMLRDLNKARIGCEGARTLATGNWGCGAFGNDHVLKFVQQWMAASETRVQHVYYHTFADKRASQLPALAAALQGMTVCELWRLVKSAASAGDAATFRRELLAAVAALQKK